MKKIYKASIVALLIIFSLNVNAQVKQNNSEKYRLIAGVRVNPLIVYDLKGNSTEYMRLHGEIGALFNKKIYTSLGYTAVANSIYNFNEYWFIGLNKKVPVSFVVSEEYMVNNNKLFIQTGTNIKLSKIGNFFMFLFTPVNNFDIGLKVGVFIPLNVVLKKK